MIPFVMALGVLAIGHGLTRVGYPRLAVVVAFLGGVVVGAWPA